MSRKRIRDPHMIRDQLRLHLHDFLLEAFRIRLVLEAESNVRDGQFAELVAVPGRGENIVVEVVDELGT